MVERTARSCFAATEPERNAEQHREEHRGHRELDRRGEPLAELVVTVRAASSMLSAEVALEPIVLTYVPVLHVDRLVEPVLVAGLRDRAGVARSPSSDSAGLPGSAWTQRKTRIESPSRIGTSSISRRTTKRSIGIVVRRLAMPLLDRHAGERSATSDRARHVARDALLEGDRRHGVRVRHARQELHDHLVRLLVVARRACPDSSPARPCSGG